MYEHLFMPTEILWHDKKSTVYNQLLLQGMQLDLVYEIPFLAATQIKTYSF
jgi:hypothetical protein